MVDQTANRRRTLRNLSMMACMFAGLALVTVVVGRSLDPVGSRQAVAATPGSAAFAMAASVASAPAKPDTEAQFHKQIQPFLKKYCTECHGEDDENAGLRLDKYTKVSEITADRKAWEKVFDILEVGAMPPGDASELPTDSERDAVVAWLETVLFDLDCVAERDPGRVTIRRLNRAEYNNSIRDLLGVDFEPARDFPSDDVGEGFDNIGDVLSISPLLMEKYLDAAETITEKAIFINHPLESPLQRFGGKKLKPSKGVKQGWRGFWTLSSTGEVAAEINASKKGQYTLRAEAAAAQAGADLAHMEFRIDGKPVHTFDVAGDRAPEVYETTIELSAGKHRFAAAFTNDYYNPKASNPKDRDRNLYINFLETQGPFGLKPDQLPAAHRRLMVCLPDETHTPADCARMILQPFASRAFRRPVTEAETARWIPLVELALAEGEPFERGIQLAVQAILVSPHFLFRVELDNHPHDPAAQHDVSQYELASRLSYFLWSSLPDDELTDLAARGELENRDVLEQQVRRMLADPKSQALIDNFASQWLNLRSLDEVAPDPKLFPTFNNELRTDMRRETELFFESVMRDDRSILDFLDARFTFLNERLAEHYGIEGVSGNEFRQVSLETQPRAGVLTHSSILTITSNPTRTSPVKRGKWIMENILGTSPPPPPENVPELEVTAEATPNATLREQLELHREDPGCASCHRQMDALGFGFENFDAVGVWRERDGASPIDASATLPGDISFNGPVELVQILKGKKAQFSRSLVRKMLTYALGRGLQYYDKCAVDKITSALAENDYRFSTLVIEIVNSEPFQMRRGEGKNQ